GYIPAAGDAQSILGMSGTATGTFASTILANNIDIGYNLYSGEAVRTVYVAALGSKFFNNSANNLDWGTAANWTGGLPASTDEARIDTNFAVTHASGTNTIGALTITGGNSLNVSGGSLAVGGNTSLDGTLTVSGTGSTQLNGALSGTGSASVEGGTLAINGATSSLANVSLSGGTLTGTGNLTISNSFAKTGGTIGGTFSGLSITQASGNLAPGALAVNGPVSLTVSAGALALDSISGTSIFGKAAGGNVTLNSGTALAASGTSDALVLAASGNFVNNAGATALSAPNGRWIVYSTNPSADTKGGLAYNFKHYGLAYTGSAYAGAGSGNGFIYSVTPSVTPSLTGTVSKVYDGTTAATLAAANFAVSGALDGDTIVLDNPVAGTYADRHAGSGKSVSATVALTGASNGAATVYGYQLASTTASGAVGEITPRPLLLSAAPDSKVYDATTNSTGTVTAAGLVGEDSFTSAGQAFDSKNAGARTLSVNSGYSVSDGHPVAAGSNYAVTTATASGSITPFGLSVSGVTAKNRVYDASTAAPLDSTAASLVGVFAGDAVALNIGSGSFADKNVATAKPVTVTGTALSGADAGNYSFNTAATATANITPATRPGSVPTSPRPRSR
ncbi:MAG: hypothetical protein HYU75_08265, partial [Betaproteobacteria bacterium]|nr:hypothetical protein [Betaproteobacteria bacterium]